VGVAFLIFLIDMFWINLQFFPGYIVQFSNYIVPEKGTRGFPISANLSYFNRMPKDGLELLRRSTAWITQVDFVVLAAAFDQTLVAIVYFKGLSIFFKAR
jgi:hypothetical protein